MKKNIGFESLIMYSTNPDAVPQTEAATEETIEKKAQKLLVRYETKHRAGKPVTMVEGFRGTVVDCEALGKLLKTKCGCGGSVKDQQILIQGDMRQKVLDLLVKEGYTLAKRGN
ncbi:MAG: translation initiation factor [Chitinophagales bacterium]|jgi:translation initiation factor 1|nr:translation initiation factor [Chitinophagales bacterium]